MAARIFRSTFKGVEGSLEEIKEVKSGFGDERTMQDLIEENLGVMFPDHEFVKREFALANQRIDTVAFNRKAQSFVLIEYKKNKVVGVVEQATSYLRLLDERKADFLQLYHEKHGRSFTKKDIAWDKSKAIIISPSFTEHQLSAAKGGKEPVELYQISKYENGIMAFDNAAHQKQDNGRLSPDRKTIAEAEHLKRGSPKVQNLYNKLKSDFIEDMPSLKVKPKKYVINMVNENDKIICTIEVRKRSMELSYTTRGLVIERRDQSFVQHMVKPDGTKIGSRGSGDYRSKIEDEGSVTRAIRYVRQVHDSESKNTTIKQGHASNVKSRPKKRHDEDDYLSTHGSDKTRALYRELRDRLSTDVLGIDIRATVRYIGWRSSTSGKMFCRIEVLKKSLNIVYITERLTVPKNDINFVVHVAKNGKKTSTVSGHGKYRSKISNREDIAKAIPYINKVYMEKEK